MPNLLDHFQAADRRHIPAGSEKCGCCKGSGLHPRDGQDETRCARCDKKGYVRQGSRAPYCDDSRNRPRRKHWREAAMPRPDYDPSDPLPVGRGVWYRWHKRDQPLDEAHARSRSLEGTGIEQVGLRGYSAFASPHHLSQYLDQMGWLGTMRGRDVIAFHGKEVGRGNDDEPLVVPMASPHCCGRVIHSKMPMRDFEDKIWDDPHYSDKAPPQWDAKNIRDPRDREYWRNRRSSAREAMADVSGYGISHRPLSDGAPAHDLTEAYQEDIYTHPQYWAGAWPDKAAAEGLAQLRRVRGKPDAMVDLYRASHHSDPHEFNTGDWVSLSKTYAEQHAYAESGSDDPETQYRVHHVRVPARHVRDAGTDQYREQGYWGPPVACCGHRKEAAAAGARPEYGPEPEYEPAPEGIGDDERMAHGDRQRQVSGDWRRHIRRGLSLGHLDNESALKLGYHGWGHDTESGRGGPGWHPLPQQLYHVTTDEPGVRREGLRTQEERGARSGTGLGSSEEDSISTTSDHEIAHGIHSALHEYHHFLNHGRPADLIARAALGDKGSRPFHQDLIRQYGSRWEKGDPLPRELDGLIRGKEIKHETLGRHEGEMQGWTPSSRPDASSWTSGHVPPREYHNLWERDASPGDQLYGKSQLWKNFSAHRAWNGGPYDPTFMSNDVHRFAKMNPDHFALLHLRPKPGAQGYHLPGEGEWRFTTGDAIEVHHAEHLGGLDKEAAAGHLANPYTRGTEWFHGTQAHKEDLAGGFVDPASMASGAYEIPQSEDDDPGHWNRLLGTHFAADHKIAREFANGEHSSSGGDGYGDWDEQEEHKGIVHARLGVRNPKVYASEHDMDHEAYEHEFRAGNHPVNHLREYESDEDGEAARDEMWPSTMRIHHDHGTSEISRSTYGPYMSKFEGHPMRTAWLNTHPDKAGIAMRFKERLESAGHDGVTYRNEYEHSSRGAAANLSAIAFHSHQIEVTQHHQADEFPEHDEPPNPRLSVLRTAIAHFPFDPHDYSRAGERVPGTPAELAGHLRYAHEDQGLEDELLPGEAHERAHELRGDEMDHQHGERPFGGSADTHPQLIRHLEGHHPGWREFAAEPTLGDVMRGAIGLPADREDDPYRLRNAHDRMHDWQEEAPRPPVPHQHDGPTDPRHPFRTMRPMWAGPDHPERGGMSYPHQREQLPGRTLRHPVPGSPPHLSAWMPGRGIFTGTHGLDHRLFNEQGELKPGVRAAVLEKMDQAIRVDIQITGSEWQDIVTLYLAGSEASEWTGPRLEGNSDFDVLADIDYDGWRGYQSRSAATMTDDQITSAFNAAMRGAFNDPAFWIHVKSDACHAPEPSVLKTARRSLEDILPGRQPDLSPRTMDSAAAGFFGMFVAKGSSLAGQDGSPSEKRSSGKSLNAIDRQTSPSTISPRNLELPPLRSADIFDFKTSRSITVGREISLEEEQIPAGSAERSSLYMKDVAQIASATTIGNITSSAAPGFPSKNMSVSSLSKEGDAQYAEVPSRRQDDHSQRIMTMPAVRGCVHAGNASEDFSATDAIVGLGHSGRKISSLPLNISKDITKKEDCWIGPFSLTGYCNGRKITEIRPYAAWDITHNRWLVKPPHLPAWSAEQFPQGPALFQEARALVAQVRAILRLPEPFRRQEASRIWQYIHEGRKRAFSIEGEGWVDSANVLEKALDQASGHLVDKLKASAYGQETGPAALGHGLTAEMIHA